MDGYIGPVCYASYSPDKLVRNCGISELEALGNSPINADTFLVTAVPHQAYAWLMDVITISFPNLHFHTSPLIKAHQSVYDIVVVFSKQDIEPVSAIPEYGDVRKYSDVKISVQW